LLRPLSPAPVAYVGDIVEVWRVRVRVRARNRIRVRVMARDRVSTSVWVIVIVRVSLNLRIRMRVGVGMRTELMKGNSHQQLLGLTQLLCPLPLALVPRFMGIGVYG